MSRRVLIIAFFFLFVVKLGVSFNYAKRLFCRHPELGSGVLCSFTGDSFSYTGAMENYITSGEYYFLFNGKKVYAGRVPHYSIPYYLLRQVFDKETSLDLFVALQVLFETIAFFLVSLLIFEITRSKLTFFLSLLFSAASFFYTHYSIIPITDAPAASLLLISFWFLFRYLNSEIPRFKNWVFFSILLAIATILRPYFGAIFILVAAILLFKYRLPVTNVFKKGAVYAIALFFFLAPWIIRNYSRSGKLMIFQQDKYAGYDVSREVELTRSMLSSIGEDASTTWDKTTAAGFFTPSMYKNSSWQVPAEILTDSLLKANFFAIRNLCIDGVDDRLQSAAFNLHYNVFIDGYRTRYKVKYYFLNYIRRVKKFLIHSGSYYFSYNKTDGCNKESDYYIKLGQSLFYYLCLIPGFIGLIWLARVKKYGLIFLLPTISLIIIFPIILGFIEWRYFLPFYFFHQIGLFYIVNQLILFFKPAI